MQCIKSCSQLPVPRVVQQMAPTPSKRLQMYYMGEHSTNGPDSSHSILSPPPNTNPLQISHRPAPGPQSGLAGLFQILPHRLPPLRLRSGALLLRITWARVPTRSVSRTKKSGEGRALDEEVVFLVANIAPSSTCS